MLAQLWALFRGFLFFVISGETSIFSSNLPILVTINRSIRAINAYSRQLQSLDTLDSGMLKGGNRVLQGCNRVLEGCNRVLQGCNRALQGCNNCYRCVTGCYRGVTLVTGL